MTYTEISSKLPCWDENQEGRERRVRKKSKIRESKKINARRSAVMMASLTK